MLNHTSPQLQNLCSSQPSAVVKVVEQKPSKESFLPIPSSSQVRDLAQERGRPPKSKEKGDCTVETTSLYVADIEQEHKTSTQSILQQEACAELGRNTHNSAINNALTDQQNGLIVPVTIQTTSTIDGSLLFDKTTEIPQVQ
jgi:hypothetical protein